MSGPSISSLSFLLPGNFTDDDPYEGLEGTLRLFEYGEELGFDGAWILGLETDDFAQAQLSQIRTYREQFSGAREPRIVVGRVIVPLDGADAATRRKYRDYQASRHQRTLAPKGTRRALIAPDLVGRAEEILQALHADPVLSEVSELQLELPYAFAHGEYRQILSDVVDSIAPELGWSPAPADEKARTGS
jgi:hypothetical protein